MPESPIVPPTVEKVAQLFTEAPPERFDLARQVRVYSAYLQYVEISLTGTAIQRNRIEIPESIQNFGVSKELEGRLKTTFNLIEKGGKLSSKNLDDHLNKIRKDFTPSLGKKHGSDRVILKRAKTHLENRIIEFRTEIDKHQKMIKDELQKHIDESRKQIIEYYKKIVAENPPDSLLGKGGERGDEVRAEQWLEKELENVFPSAESLIQNMKLEVAIRM